MTEEMPQGGGQPEPGGLPQDDEEIVARSQVMLDGDLSRNKLIALIGLGREEEALDYKPLPFLRAMASMRRSVSGSRCRLVESVTAVILAGIPVFHTPRFAESQIRWLVSKRK